MHKQTIQLTKDQSIDYMKIGKGNKTIVILHGLFNFMDNWEQFMQYLSKDYTIIMPLLPLTEITIKKANIAGIFSVVKSFLQTCFKQKIHLIGNSLGGHLAAMYAIHYPRHVEKLVLCCSSGLYENIKSYAFLKRGNYEYIETKTKETFYDPQVASKELVDQVFKIATNLPQALRLVSIAKSAQRNSLEKELPNIPQQTLLVWGSNDTITPPNVAHKFNKLIKKSQLLFINKCCHAPMIEHPDKFNRIVKKFLDQPTSSS